MRSTYGAAEFAYHASSWTRQPDMVAEDLFEAVERVLGAALDSLS